MFKTLASVTLLWLCLSAAHAFAVLNPEKGGTPNKTYTEKSAPELTIATYNIAAARVSDLESVAKAIQALNADIVSLNEVDNQTARSGKTDQVERLAQLTGMHGVFGKAIDFDGGQYGIALLSKYPIEAHQVFKLPSGNEEQRVLLVSQISVPKFDSPVIVMNTHLDWHEDLSLRLEEAKEINNIALGNTESQFPEIASSVKLLIGDFNDPEGGPAMAELSRDWTLVKKEGADMRTWPSVNPAIDLDHIQTFKGQRWRLEKLFIPNQQSSALGINWPQTSDHVPVVAKLKLLEQ